MVDFFRRKPPPPPPRDVAALLSGLTAPAVRFVQADDGASYLGGEVALPTALDWPSKGGKPLTLLASLDLGEINAAVRIEWLPSSGRLLFFYDVDEQPWGFDPKDRGSWAVLFVPDSQAAATGTTPGTAPLERKPIKFARLESVPSQERPG